MVRIKVANMACGGCGKGVVATLRTAALAVEATLRLGRREVEVDTSDAAPLLVALRAVGWDASEVRG